ncbi:MAG TPA: DUF3089 domain-containing protein [Noviherbaspirillum sp.]|jgi:hypothetical protein|uniref:DUF3089 domain-containing protein n=1 Tax=Noviherbaspirillum sp. TaxID=1926288 RepID=UPI002DDD8480|nr:DUF3089 domain-containing protein [Noviherbaspirillum sp.]HEV2610456.1 DUF3089 domain-containing protein [Noviherbaspirillum sp.]
MYQYRIRPLQTFCLIAAAASLSAACTTTRTSSPASSAAAPVPAASAAARNDYARDDNWLCRPGRTDACVTDLTATMLKAGAESGAEAWKANPDAAIDCFYVYPTISNDPTPNSDMTAGPEEKRTVQQQFARFGSECRLYAPMYRQVTLAGLRNAMSGQPSGIDPKMAYGDVVDAWNHYLKNDNKGRGVVLVGHSQGARMLGDLVKNEIEGKPAQKQLISALLIGYNVPVPKGKDTGGQFRQIPLCRSAAQTGCVVSYVTFRDTSPPPANSRFGRLTDGNVAACTNPAALAGGRAALRSYLPAKSNLLGQPLASSRWGAVTQNMNTQFIATSDIVTAECVERDNASYLSVTVQPAYAAKNIDIPGDLTVNNRTLTDWGLHLVDVDIAQGNLIDLVRQQSQAYLKAAR